MEQLHSIDRQLKEIKSMLLSQKSVLNFEEVAEFTGLSKSYLYKLTCTGGIPCYKPNSKHLYFKKDEIESWLLQNRKTTSDELEVEANSYVYLQKGKK
jgi:excisionase family DNA binding protein